MGQMQRIGKHATTVKVEQGVGRVTYHDTDVVVWNEKIVTLNTGGWRTATTKARMNQTSNQFGLGYQVYQEKGEWYIWFPGTDREEIPFEGYNWVMFDRNLEKV